VIRGWNGSLHVDPDAVTIRRGVRGLITRHDARDQRIPFREIREVWFQAPPSRWGVGYIHFVRGPETLAPEQHLAVLRHQDTVSFTGRDPDAWQSLAREVASRAGVELHDVPAVSSDELLRLRQKEGSLGFGSSRARDDFRL
jgi:hypothetical protein